MSKSIFADLEEFRDHFFADYNTFFEDKILDVRENAQCGDNYIREFIEYMDDCIKHADRVEESKREEFIGLCKDFQEREGTTRVGCFDDECDQAEEYDREIKSIGNKVYDTIFDIIAHQDEARAKKEFPKLVALNTRCHELFELYQPVYDHLDNCGDEMCDHYIEVEEEFFKYVKEKYGFTTEGIYMMDTTGKDDDSGDEWYDASAKGWHY